jgi:lipopolysaccharide transport system ATP-binding protein
VKRYSSGMYMRLAFSVAAHLDPEILLVDEVLAVGDADFQKKCLGRMEEMGGSGRTVLFVSHSMQSVLRLCPRVLMLEKGLISADGLRTDVIGAYIGRGGGAAIRTWPSIDEAPGDDCARLKCVRVLNDAGQVAPEIDARSPFKIEVEYWTPRVDGERPIVVLEFYNSEGVALFSAHHNDSNRASVAQDPAFVRATCTVPPNLFAQGAVFVLAAVCTYGPWTIHAIERDAVAFHVVDPGQAHAPRGGFPGELPGVMRPLTSWESVAASPFTPGEGSRH